MYILGFLLLFLGVFLLLYSILVLFFSKNQTHQEKKHIPDSTSKEDQSLNVHIKSEPLFVPQAQASKDKESQSPKIETISPETNSPTEKNGLKPPQETSAKSVILDEIKSKLKTKIPQKKFQEVTQETKSQFLKADLELFLTGYLYCDPAHTSYVVLEKKDKTPSDSLSNLIRLGNATLEWNKDKFILNYVEKQIDLMFYNIKEIRFTDECAVFISKTPEEPYYYFLSKQIDQLKAFLHQLSKV